MLWSRFDLLSLRFEVHRFRSHARGRGQFVATPKSTFLENEDGSA
jgi:hypothetical protein